MIADEINPIFYSHTLQASLICTNKYYLKQGRKRPLDTPKKMIERREREKEREREKGRRRDIEREGEIRERERGRERKVKGI